MVMNPGRPSGGSQLSSLSPAKVNKYFMPCKHIRQPVIDKRDGAIYLYFHDMPLVLLKNPIIYSDDPALSNNKDN